MRIKRVWPLAAVLAASATCRLQAEQAATTTVVTQPAPVVVKAPSTLTEIRKQRDELAKALAPQAWTTATRPATTQPITPATQPGDVATNLWLLIKDYDSLLAQQEGLLAQLEELKSDEGIKKAQAEIDQFRKLTKELKAKLAAGKAAEETGSIKEVRELYDKLNLENDTQVKAQTARQERLAAIGERRKAANEEVAKARKKLDDVLQEFTDRTTTAPVGTERDQLILERRSAELAALRALTELECIGLVEQLLNQRQRREERRLAALSPYVQTLRRWMNALEKAATKSKLEQIKANLDAATGSGDKLAELYWTTAHELEAAYVQFEGYDNATRDRFPVSEYGKLENKMTQDEGYWESFVESLPRRSGQEVLNRYKKVRKDLAEARAVNGQLSDKLDKSVEEREQVYQRREIVMEKIGLLREQLREMGAKADDARAAKFEAQLDERRGKLIEEMDGIVSLQDALIKRLDEACDKHTAYLELLERTRSRLYWSYLTVRDQGLAQPDIAGLSKEWRADARYVLDRLSPIVTSAGEQLAAASVARWCLSILALLASAPLAWWLRRRCDARSDTYEEHLSELIQEEGIIAVGIGERMKLAALRLVANTALLVGPFLAVLLGLFILGMSNMPLRLGVTAILLVLGCRLAFGVVRALFAPGRPRFRLIRCSNKVAQYYRRSLRGLVWLTIVITPLPLLLGIGDILPTTRAYLWQLYKTLALLICVLFVMRKQLVLKVVGRSEDLKSRWLYTLVASLFPLIQVGAAVLFVLQIMGYDALTNYVILNAALTFAVLLAVALLTRYADDLSAKYQRRLARERQEEQEAQQAAAEAEAAASEPESDATRPSAGDGRETALVESEEEESVGESEFFTSLAVVIFNWAVRLVGLVLILSVWGITLVEIQSALNYPLSGSGDDAVTLWRVLAAVLAVIVAVFASRFIRSVLTNRVYPAYDALDRGARAAINTLTHYFLIVLGIYAAMQLMYVNLGALTVLVGTLGLGLGLGLQPLFINFISGLMILFERHIKVGDVVEVGDRVGEVTKISMRSTAIKTFDNIDMVIPNAEFITSQVTNWSLQDRRIRGHLTIGVAYGSDVQLVRKLLLQVADEHPKVLADPEPNVWFTDFGDNALTFRLNVWFEDLSDRLSSLTELRFEIDRIFAEQNINIPFPQRTLSTINNEPIRVELTQSRGEPKEPADPAEPDA